MSSSVGQALFPLRKPLQQRSSPASGVIGSDLMVDRIAQGRSQGLKEGLDALMTSTAQAFQENSRQPCHDVSRDASGESGLRGAGELELTIGRPSCRINIYRSFLYKIVSRFADPQ